MKESREDLATLYVLDQLDDSTRAVFAARLAREPELAALVHELEAAYADGVRSLPQRQPSAELLGRIETRLDQEIAEGKNLPLGQIGRSKSAPLQPNQTVLVNGPWLAWARWGIAAVIAVSLGTLALQSLRGPQQPVFIVVGLDGTTSTLAELPARGVSADPDARFIRLASLAQGYLGNPASLPGSPSAPAGERRGYAVFDPASRQGFIAIEHLPAIRADQRYHLWVADASTGRVRDAGILPLSGGSRGLFSFLVAPADGAAATSPNFFVTVEEASAASSPADQPRGQVVLGKESI
jgi:anti-sigma-K factor RskA